MKIFLSYQNIIYNKVKIFSYQTVYTYIRDLKNFWGKGNFKDHQIKSLFYLRSDGNPGRINVLLISHSYLAFRKGLSHFNIEFFPPKKKTPKLKKQQKT